MATAVQFVKNEIMPDALEDKSVGTMARYFFATMWLIIFTGALRKWVAPNFKLLYLSQDVPLGLAYLYALWSGLIKQSMLLYGILLFSAILMLQGFIQVMITGLNPFIAMVGFHHYLFYLPVMLVFPFCLNEKYRRNVIRWNMLLALPMCPLAIVQSLLPAASFINQTSEGNAMGVSGSDAIRVSGTYNFTLPYGIWVAFTLSLVIGEWLLPHRERVFKSRLLMIAITSAINICYLISGSRTDMLIAAVALLGGAIASALMGSIRAISTVLVCVLLVPIFGGLVAVIAPHEFEIIKERFTGKRYTSEATQRVSYIAVGFVTDPPLTLVGSGIGMGIDAAHIGTVGGYDLTYRLNEYDTIRNVYELGTLVGLFYVFVRIFFSVGMVGVAFWIVYKRGSPHVLPIAFYSFIQCYLGDLTRLGTSTGLQIMMGYAFIFGAYMYPPNQAGQELTADSNMMRSV